MATTVAQIYAQVCYDLLEPGGLQSGILTEQEVLDYLGEILMDFLRDTGMAWQIFTQQIQANVSQYAYPDLMPLVLYVYQNAVIVEKDDLYSSYMIGQWSQKPGQTKAYHEDGLPIKTIELLPAPNWNGTLFTPSQGPPFGTTGYFQPGSMNLTFVGTSLASKETWLITDALDTIPDSATPYLVFGILAKVFSSDSEARDPIRAGYCKQRYEEGVAMWRSIVMSLTADSSQGQGEA